MIQMDTPTFANRVQACFASGAPTYQRGARLQAAVAERLAGWGACLTVPAGSRADLGAGSGLLARALERRMRFAGASANAVLRLDQCPELLAQEHQRDPAVPQLLWDLNRGLPAQLQGSALLASSFALQWLEQPALQLQRWCRALQPGGWLLLAVPTAGSFSLWRQAAARAAVPYTALALPEASELVTVAARELNLQRQDRLHFSRPNPGGRAFLAQIKALGAQASQAAPLNPGQMRRLLAHWPSGGEAIGWEVQLLVGQKR